MEVHQSCFVDATAFTTDFPASRADFVVMRPECVVALPETLVPRSDFAASTADVRQFVVGQDCASRMNSDEDFVYAAPLKVRRPRTSEARHIIEPYRSGFVVYVMCGRCRDFSPTF
ncbi:hypothetical protein RB195_021496 [Necator americanus]|uniref:Uncharacterized protein n=1 Tax=Necator americanus TaxID=51031 RepID=A0ABR1EC02_NECAM